VLAADCLAAGRTHTGGQLNRGFWAAMQSCRRIERRKGVQYLHAKQSVFGFCLVLFQLLSAKLRGAVIPAGARTYMRRYAVLRSTAQTCTHTSPKQVSQADSVIDTSTEH